MINVGGSTCGTLSMSLSQINRKQKYGVYLLFPMKKSTEYVLKSEAEIWSFSACAVKIRYIAFIYGGIAEIPARIQEIGVEEHGSDVRFQTGSGQMTVSRMRNKSTQYSPYLWQNRRNSRVFQEIGVVEHDGNVRCQTGSAQMAVFAHAQYKIRYITLIYGRIAKISASYWKSGSRNTLVTSDFIREMEIWPFCSCAVKNTQYSPYLYQTRRNARVLMEIWVEEHDSDVRFQTGSGNMAVSRLRNKNTQYNPYLWRNLLNSRVLQEIGVEEHDGDVTCQTGNGNMAVLPMHSKNTQHNPCYRKTFVVVQLLSSRYQVAHQAPVCFQLDENSIESALKSPKFPHLQGNRGQGIKRRCQFFFTRTA